MEMISDERLSLVSGGVFGQLVGIGFNSWAGLEKTGGTYQAKEYAEAARAERQVFADEEEAMRRSLAQETWRKG
jgi:hypothetical protein